MPKYNNKLSYSCEDAIGRTYTLSIDQDEWVEIIVEGGGEEIGRAFMDGETMERLFQFWRHHVMDAPPLSASSGQLRGQIGQNKPPDQENSG